MHKLAKSRDNILTFLLLQKKRVQPHTKIIHLLTGYIYICIRIMHIYFVHIIFLFYM